MTVPRRHHYVSQSSQKRFCDDDGRIYDKRRRERGVYRTQPGNAFIEVDLNTTEYKDGSKEVGLEGFFSELESDVAPIIEKIISNVLKKFEPRLTGEERNIWDNYYYFQQKRAPDVFDRIGVTQNYEQDFPKLLDDFERDVRPLSPEERAEAMLPANIERSKQWAMATARGRGSETVLTFLRKQGLVFGLVEHARRSFIIGDHPIVLVGAGDISIYPFRKAWMPIDAHVAVCPGRSEGRESLELLNVDEVRKINLTIFQSSNVVASRSEALLRSLAGI